MLLIERYRKRSDEERDRYNDDIIGKNHFRVCSWVFPLGFIEEKCLVNCGDSTGDCTSIHGIRTDFRCL